MSSLNLIIFLVISSPVFASTCPDLEGFYKCNNQNMITEKEIKSISIESSDETYFISRKEHGLYIDDNGRFQYGDYNINYDLTLGLTTSDDGENIIEQNIYCSSNELIFKTSYKSRQEFQSKEVINVDLEVKSTYQIDQNGNLTYQTYLNDFKSNSITCERSSVEID